MRQEIEEFEAQSALTLDESDEQEFSLKDPYTRRWQEAALSRVAGLNEIALYRTIQVFQPNLFQAGLLPALSDEEGLALFKYLQNNLAFAQPGMDIERQSSGSDVTDEDIYDQLRYSGARWNQRWSAWYRFGRRVVFGGVEPVFCEQEKEFKDLQDADALRLPCISARFREPSGDNDFTPSDFQVWQRIKADGKSWDPERMVWVHREGRLAGQYAYGGREVSLYLDPSGFFMPRRVGTAYNSDTGHVERLF